MWRVDGIVAMENRGSALSELGFETSKMAMRFVVPAMK
jgi:hypothetical protein